MPQAGDIEEDSIAMKYKKRGRLIEGMRDNQRVKEQQDNERNEVLLSWRPKGDD